MKVPNIAKSKFYPFSSDNIPVLSLIILLAFYLPVDYIGIPKDRLIILQSKHKVSVLGRGDLK